MSLAITSYEVTEVWTTASPLSLSVTSVIY